MASPKTNGHNGVCPASGKSTGVCPASGAAVKASGSSCTSSKCIKKWSIIALVLAVGYAVCVWLESINPSFWILDPEGLNGAFQKSIATAKEHNQGNNATFIVQELMDNLVERYPDADLQTDFTNKNDWVFNNAGGAMGAMYLIHASISEYLIIFGTATGTEGHTGVHTADDYFHILKGKQMAYAAGDLEALVFEQGDVNLMPRGVVRQYMMEPESWAMEYARGWIPLMLPFGFADMIFSTLDVGTIYNTVRLTGGQMIKNLLRGKI